MFNKLITKLWSIREIYMPFVVGISLSFLTLIFLGVSIKFSIYIIEDLSIQLILLHPAKKH